MRPTTKKIRNASWAWIPIAFLPLLACVACSPMSEQIKDLSVGMNGGFEHTRSGLPVNWIVYSPATIPSGSYELLFDDTDFKEGEQSLRFDVEECSSTGGWHSPGLTQEFPAEPGTTYAIRFWIKSKDCDWTVSVGAVGAKTGEYETVDSSGVRTDSWRRVDREYTMPPVYERLRLELSITSPGSLWIDDVRIEPLVD